MTDFLSWWADHWPAVPAAIVWTLALAYLIWLVRDERKRRREI